MQTGIFLACGQCGASNDAGHSACWRCGRDLSGDRILSAANFVKAGGIQDAAKAVKANTSQPFRTFIFWVFAVFIFLPIMMVLAMEMGAPSPIGMLVGIGLIITYVARKRSNVRRQRKAERKAHEEQAAKLAADERIRASSSWMADPDDYKELPSVDLEALPEDVSAEWVRKYTARQDAIKYVDLELTASGREVGREQYEAMIQKRAIDQERMKESVDAEVRLEQLNRCAGQRRHRELLDAIDDVSRRTNGR